MHLSVRRLVVVQVLLLAFMVLNSNIHLPCFLKFREEFGVDERTVQLAFIINPFIAAATSIGYGYLIEKIGQKRLLFVTIFLFIAGTITCLSATSIKSFMVGRVLQGLGDAGIAVATAVILGSLYKGAQYARIQAISNGVLSFSWAFAPVIGASIYAYCGWRWNFALMLILIITTSMPLLQWQQETRTDDSASSNLQNPEESIEPKTFLSICLEKKFLALTLAHAVPLGIFTAIETSSPFIFMGQFAYTPQQYANINLIIITSNIIGSMLYLLVVRRLKLEATIRIGLFPYCIFLLLSLVFLMFKSTNTAWFFVILFSLEAFALPFFISTCTTKIVELYPAHLGKSLSLIALMRNVVSFAIAFFCSYALKVSIGLLIGFIILFTVLSLYFIYQLATRLYQYGPETPKEINPADL